MSGGNGVYKYGASGSGLPTQTFNANNYWVDVVFDTGGTPPPPDTTPPTVSGVVPAAGATGVSTAVAVKATFSEPMTAGTITGSTFELRNAANALVAGGVSYDSATQTATLTPSAPLAINTTYTATVKGGSAGVKDVAGNALATDFTWTFTTAASPPPPTVPAVSGIMRRLPATVSANDTSAVELGVKFSADLDGFVTGLRFYKGPQNTGSHVGHLWTSNGTLLASVTFTGERATGWQQVTLPTPVAITANTTYVASYHAPVGRYALNSAYFTAEYVNAPLRALARGGRVAMASISTVPAAGFPPRPSMRTTTGWTWCLIRVGRPLPRTPPHRRSVGWCQRRVPRGSARQWRLKRPLVSR